MHVKSPNVYQGLCHAKDGTKVPGTHFKTTETITGVRLVGHGSRYVGLEHLMAKVTELTGNCHNDYADTGSPTPHATYRWVMTEKK